MQAAGDMRRIMFPVMGMVFGVSWVILAILLSALPHAILLLALGLSDAVFGIFLIFLPVVATLGLFYTALGAFTIGVSRHGSNNPHLLTLVGVGAIVAFLLTGGLTLVSLDGSGGGDFFSRLEASVVTCENDLDITNYENQYWNLNTRCENWLLYTEFCVFLLFLLQPLTIIVAFFTRHSVGSVNDKGSPEV